MRIKIFTFINHVAEKITLWSKEKVVTYSLKTVWGRKKLVQAMISGVRKEADML